MKNRNELFLSVKFSTEFMNDLGKYIEKKQKESDKKGGVRKILRRDVVGYAISEMIKNDTYKL